MEKIICAPAPSVVLKVLTTETETRTVGLFIFSHFVPLRQSPGALNRILVKVGGDKGKPPTHLAFNLHGTIVAATGLELDSLSLPRSLTPFPSLSVSLP